jgi:chlorobactene glucosyltransferase
MLMSRALLALLPYITALPILSIMTIHLIRNLSFLHGVRHQAIRPSSLPRVSILVPARNEAATISSCITSLLSQDYPDFEVIVLDDASTDSTGEQLELLAARFPQLTVISSNDNPPAGWNGKSYACHRLATQATGSWLLFTDADTLHSPQSVRSGMAQAQALHVPFLSAFPYQQTHSWSERILVSFIIDFLPLLGLDYQALWHGKGDMIAANGQYILVEAARYHAIRGHKAIGTALVDDFALAQRFRESGEHIALVDGTAMLSCRMYHSFRETWDGFSKNLLLGLATATSGKQKASFWLASLFAWGYACIFVIPFIDLLRGTQIWLATITICWTIALRTAVVLRLKRSATEVVTTPLAAWGTMALGLSALYSQFRHRPLRWKDREYHQ